MENAQNSFIQFVFDTEDNQKIEVMRVDVAGIHVNPDIHPDDAALQVLLALDKYIKQVFETNNANLLAVNKSYLEALQNIANEDTSKRAAKSTIEKLVATAKAALDDVTTEQKEQQ